MNHHFKYIKTEVTDEFENLNTNEDEKNDTKDDPPVVPQEEGTTTNTDLFFR